MTDVLTAAARGGRLAVAQTRIVISALKKIHPDIKIRIKKITTEGDRDKRTTLWKLKTSGFFTSQLEDTLLAGQADFAVHSFKDLPTQSSSGLAVAAVLDRKFPEDCLVASAAIDSLEQLPPKARIGTSSLRRMVQIKRLRPDCEVLPIRGNVTTRLRKLAEGRFDAIILARAGLERLNAADRISFVLEPAEFVPAPAQGALAVQIRADDEKLAELVSAVDDKNARTTCLAERRILETTGAGCHAPVGAFARIVGDDIIIEAFISDLDGSNFIKRRIEGHLADALKLADKISVELLDAGGVQKDTGPDKGVY